MSKESCKAVETLCQWMDESGLDWDTVAPDETDEMPAQTWANAIAHLEQCWSLPSN
jgi:hypothetical protein